MPEKGTKWGKTTFSLAEISQKPAFCLLMAAVAGVLPTFDINSAN